MKIYWLYLPTAFLGATNCFLAVRHQHFLVASLLGVTALLNFAVF